MTERRDTPRVVSRLFIPERHFWTDEAAKQFLNDDGMLRLNPDGTPDFKPLDMPLIDPDNYPIVDIPAFVQMHKALFVEGSQFPKVYRKEIVHRLGAEGVHLSHQDFKDISTADNIEHVQEQKFFRAKGKIIDIEAFRFCDNPERKIRMPWLAQNVKTDIYRDVVVPDRDLMIAHRTGANLSLMMFETAALMNYRGHGFNARKKSIEANKVIPTAPHEIKTRIDVEAAKHLRKQSREVKELYKVAQWLFFENMPDDSYFAQFKESVVNAKPRGVVSILGQVATRTPWDYSRFFRGHINLDTARNTQKNRLARSVARERRLIAS